MNEQYQEMITRLNKSQAQDFSDDILSRVEGLQLMVFFIIF